MKKSDPLSASINTIQELYLSMISIVPVPHMFLSYEDLYNISMVSVPHLCPSNEEQ
jgi:hypothetical protein